MTFKILIRFPMPRPTRMDEDSLAAHIQTREPAFINHTPITLRDVDQQAIEMRQLFQCQIRKIFAVGITMKGRVEIGTGIRHHLNLADGELGSFGIDLARCFTT